MLKLFILVILFSVTFANISYDGHKVYKVYLDGEEKRRAFSDVEQTITNLDMLGENYKENSIDILVAPSDQSKFLSFLENEHIYHETQIENVGRLIDETTPNILERNFEDFNWTSYHSYDVISNWLDSVAETYPTIANTFIAGNSYLGVPIKGVRLVFNSSATRVAVIEGGVHAREWISPAAATYVINQFLTSTDRALRAAVDQLIWYIVPVFNPDGYNRTMNGNRMHRKNMQAVEGVNCSGYTGGNGIGTDINRNFGFSWLGGGGASSNPCEETFAGTEPFSSPEAQAIRAIVDEVGKNLVLFLSFHSYSQLMLFPYGHATTPLDNYYEQYAIGKMATDAIESYNGTRYIVGSTAEAIYIATGISTDWVKATYGTTLSYCIEFRDRGQYGFILPPEQIVDASHEVLLSIIVLIEQLNRLDTLGTVYNRTTHK